MTLLAISDTLVEMLQMLQDKKLTILQHNVAGINVTLQRFDSLQWSVNGTAFTTSDALELAEFLHAQQR